MNKVAEQKPSSARHYAAVLQFLHSTYEVGADMGRSDRRALEPAELPDRPPRRPWSLGR